MATPSDWQPSQDCVVVASVTTEDARKLFTDVREVPWAFLLPFMNLQATIAVIVRRFARGCV